MPGIFTPAMKVFSVRDNIVVVVLWGEDNQKDLRSYIHRRKEDGSYVQVKYDETPEEVQFLKDCEANVRQELQEEIKGLLSPMKRR